MESYQTCFFFTRTFSKSEVEIHEDISKAFSRFADCSGSHMNVEQLHLFMVEDQGDHSATLEDAENAISLICSSKHLDDDDNHDEHIAMHGKTLLTLEDFYTYLFSTDLNSPLCKQTHDMTAPLSHYFIFTGHNSYLTGNQLSSDCSDVPIANALDRGVRVIELDIWPNSSDDDVEVLHGRTLTSPVELSKCLKSIKEHAFNASPYPVVITLEDHLTPDLQAKAAKMITEILGDLLYYPESSKLAEFPSPASLMNRILISTKPPKEYLAAGIPQDKGNGDEKGKDSSNEEAWGKEVPELKDELSSNDKDDSYQSDSDSESSDEDEQTDRPRTAIEYKNLITIHAGKPKGGLKACLAIDPNKVRRLSLSEGQLVKASESYGSDIVRFTNKNILRVYPKGTRFTSSNYNPLIGWMHGAQMVAFNMQGYGRPLWLMQGFFRANGGCGYVKKPSFLMTPDHNEVFDPQAALPVKRTLKVKVYMGDGWSLDFKKTHFDTYSPPDFYTRVGIGGVPADSVMKKTKTKEDCWVPVWNEEFTFPLTVPELAVLRIEVHEYDMSEKDDFAGQTCLPLSELKQGIRAVPLCNHKGVRYDHAKLLMRFEFY